MKIEEIKQVFDEHHIDKVKLGGFDVDGVLRGKYISLEKFYAAVDTGFGFCDVIFGWDSSDTLYDNVQLTGWHTGYPDALARIDLTSCRSCPGKPTRPSFWWISSRRMAPPWRFHRARCSVP